MNLTINVDETKFKEILEKELEAFDKEELKDIIRNGLVQCISSPEMFQSLFVSKGERYYSGYMGATELLKHAAERVDLTPSFAGFQEAANKWLLENHGEIILQLAEDVFMQGLRQHLCTEDFINRLRYSLEARMRPRE